MPRHMLKLLALTALFTVAPASAALMLSANPPPHQSRCPHHAARAPSAAAARPVAKGGATITLLDRIPEEGSLLDLGRRGFFTP